MVITTPFTSAAGAVGTAETAEIEIVAHGFHRTNPYAPKSQSKSTNPVTVFRKLGSFWLQTCLSNIISILEQSIEKKRR